MKNLLLIIFILLSFNIYSQTELLITSDYSSTYETAGYKYITESKIDALAPFNVKETKYKYFYQSGDWCIVRKGGKIRWLGDLGNQEELYQYFDTKDQEFKRTCADKSYISLPKSYTIWLPKTDISRQEKVNQYIKNK